MLLPVMASAEFSVAQTQRLHHILGSVLDAYAAAGFSDDTANNRYVHIAYCSSTLYCVCRVSQWTIEVV
jgi:hypothetical protein